MAQVARPYQLLPAGKYRLAIVSAQGISGDHAGLRLRLRVVEGQHKGIEFTSRAFLDGGTLSSLLEILVEEKEVTGTVRQIPSKKGSSYNVVDHFSPVKDSGAAESSDASENNR